MEIENEMIGRPRRRFSAEEKARGRKAGILVGTGVACACKNYGTGGDTVLGTVEIAPDGLITIRCDATEIGNAVGTAAANLYIPYSLPPSNSAHQVKALVGYNITPTTRLNANFAYGVELQNAAFPIGSGDPVNIQNQPRSSFDGRVQTLFGNVALTAQPIPKLDVRLSYTIDDRDNQSPRNGY